MTATRRVRSVIDVAERFYDALTRRSQPHLVRVVTERVIDMPAHARVLDLGAGAGRIAVEVERETRVRVTACDINFEAVRGSGEHPAGGTIVADGQALPFAPDCFAAAYLVYVIHHVPDQPGLLTEIRRVLNNEGGLVLVEFDAASWLVKTFRLLARLTGRHCRFHTPESLLGLVRTAGFDAVAQPIDRATFVVTGRRRNSPPHGGQLHPPSTGRATLGAGLQPCARRGLTYQ